MRADIRFRFLALCQFANDAASAPWASRGVVACVRDLRATFLRTVIGGHVHAGRVARVFSGGITAFPNVIDFALRGLEKDAVSSRWGVASSGYLLAERDHLRACVACQSSVIDACKSALAPQIDRALDEGRRAAEAVERASRGRSFPSRRFL